MKRIIMRSFAISTVLVMIICLCIPLIVTEKVEEVGTQQPPTTEVFIDPSEWFEVGTEPNEEDVTIPTDSLPQGPDPEDPNTWTFQLSSDEIYLLATAIHLEGGIESSRCQKYIGSVILNRMIASGQSLTQVLYAENQFSVAGQLASSHPTDLQIAIAMDLVIHGTVLPECVTFFRAHKYHDRTTVDTSFVKNYTCVDHTYFSHDIRICHDNH